MHVCRDKVACHRLYFALNAWTTPSLVISLGYTRMRAFVTVGSTRFDALVQRALSDAVVDVLLGRGYSHIVVQCGNSEFDINGYARQGDLWTRELEGGGRVEVWKFRPSLQAEFEQADLVISHAGMIFLDTALRPWAEKPLLRFWHYPRCPPAAQTTDRRPELDPAG